MPVLGLGLHMIVAILLAVHAWRSGQERWWLFVLFLFPLLGSFVYTLLVLLPEVTSTRSTRRVVRSLRASIDPGRELREARAAVEHSVTIANRVRLADALQGAGQHAQAIAAYRECLHGVNSDDADVQVKLASALLEVGQAAAARDVLDALIANRPDFKSPAGHLIYARAVAACGEKARADEEFRSLIGYFAGIEPRARYVAILRGWGDDAAADALVEDSLRHVSHMPASARELNREWIRQLRQDSRQAARTAG
jgi:hypothetical protein